MEDTQPELPAGENMLSLENQVLWLQVARGPRDIEPAGVLKLALPVQS